MLLKKDMQLLFYSKSTKYWEKLLFVFWQTSHCQSQLSDDVQKSVLLTQNFLNFLMMQIMSSHEENLTNTWNFSLHLFWSRQALSGNEKIFLEGKNLWPQIFNDLSYPLHKLWVISSFRCLLQPFRVSEISVVTSCIRGDFIFSHDLVMRNEDRGSDLLGSWLQKWVQQPIVGSCTGRNPIRKGTPHVQLDGWPLLLYQRINTPPWLPQTWADKPPLWSVCSVFPSCNFTCRFSNK